MGLVIPLLLVAVGGANQSLGAPPSIADRLSPGCVSCHGAHGEGAAISGAPRLAHLNADYLDAQLEAFAANDRHDEFMGLYARHLSPDERAALSTYFAGLPAAYAGGPFDPKLVARGRRLAQVGEWSVQVPPCASCHGAQGVGVGSLTPPLVGQREDYLLKQLMRFQAGERKGPLGLMSGIAARLSADDLRAAAAYYASLPLPGPAPAHGRRAP